MIVDGKGIAAGILKSVKAEVNRLAQPPRLTILTGAQDAATKNFLKLKGNRAAEVGIGLEVIKLPDSATTGEAITALKRVAETGDGIIVQLPLPPSLNQAAIQAAVPPELDVDAIGYSGETTDILPPVAGAISEIAVKYNVVLAGKKIVIVGNGPLVGQPLSRWLLGQGYQPLSLSRETGNNQAEIATADILILGAGVPHLITPKLIKKDVVIFDAGTSEAGGVMVGDADPACAHKAALFTPVPGGIGPITIALVLRNLINLAKAN